MLRGLNTWAVFFCFPRRIGGELEVEWLGLKLVSVWDASIAGGSWMSVLAPAKKLLVWITM